MDNETLQKQAPDYGQRRNDLGTSSGPGASSDANYKNWEVERATLTAEVSRLQHAIAELIEKSNNPKRTSPREDASVKLNAAILEKDRTISGFLHEKSGWEQEKSRLNAELEQLRQIAQGRLPRAKATVESRIQEYSRTKELETQVAALQRELDLARATARLQAQRLEKEAAGARPTANGNGELERRVAGLQRELEQERAAAKIQIQRLEKQAAEARPPANGSAETERKLAVLQKELEHERATSKLHLQRLERLAAESRPATNGNAEMERQLAALQKELEHERATSKLHIQKLEKQATEPPPTANVAAEIDRVEKLISDVTKIINDPTADLSMVIRKNVEIAELNAYLKGIQFSQSKGRSR